MSQRSLEALERLEQTDLFRQARCIALYHALPDEVQTAAFIEKWGEVKTLLLPIVEGNDLTLHAYTGTDALQCGAFGIMEPVRCEPCEEDGIDLIIVPGIAFDRHGNRLGRGKGYYDRLLRNLSAPKIGLCFDFQLHDHIPVEPFDIRMDGVVTETKTVLTVND